MKIAKIISGLGILVMTLVLIFGFVRGDFAKDGSLILQNPWGIVSLVDLYTGLSLFSVWIIFREKAVLPSIFWVSLMMVLGFFTASLYVFIALSQSKDDWTVFWMGNRAHV